MAHHSKKDWIGVEDPLWYKDAIIYQLHVKAFGDSSQDGIGDFRGLIQRLDYLQELGVDTLWLMPFYPSPLRDDGYDISDYQNVHPDYGTLADFRAFVREAHARSLKVDHRAGHQPHLRPASLVPGRAPRAARFAASGRFTSGATTTRSFRKPGSSSPIPRPPTGPGIRWRSSTTGTVSSPTSRI